VICVFFFLTECATMSHVTSQLFFNFKTIPIGIVNECSRAFFKDFKFKKYFSKKSNGTNFKGLITQIFVKLAIKDA